MKKSTEDGRVRGAGGFTLLEVLAAVAILGIWFAVLASVAIQGQRSEGENERRMRASLVADQVLTALELDFDAGEFPEGEEEFEQDEYTVRIDSLPLLELDLGDSSADLTAILENELASLSVDMRVVEVEVSWIEGTAERNVRRIAYAWDPTRFNEIMGNLPDDDLPVDDDGDDLPDDEFLEDEL